MNGRCRGFSLIELLLALAISLALVLGVTQIFMAANSTYRAQSASAGMQEDARFVLSKLLQEIRMVGVFGCLQDITDASASGDFRAARNAPIKWDNALKKLSLVTTDVGGNGGVPTWTVVSDCRARATAYSQRHSPAAGELAIPIRRLDYRLRDDQILLTAGGRTAALVSNVKAFAVSFGLADSASGTAVSSYSSNPGDPARIRSVRLSLTLADSNRRVRDQTFNVVASLRNRLP
ncbi:prepilin-type N-terminal cleavage/methylation domain-containing protein [Pseudomonas sp. BC115LW]|uniref:prepilin-type N-terminal cleavage/methylation domain-containing protein n=1 Tax=Pseudomonas sp. BC115LW TaxID=2683267 RepID=UPI0014120ED1|nr:prepilin-type N-terminal cleavage/methylation domain-containing protein [Pseudomonas sp. BC115LW]NBB35499.1 prepilin-type N-terminal cleavage/methylation domain-containing protein [Pseudomonas sp. BC115LW]